MAGSVDVLWGIRQQCHNAPVARVKIVIDPSACGLESAVRYAGEGGTCPVLCLFCSVKRESLNPMSSINQVKLLPHWLFCCLQSYRFYIKNEGVTNRNWEGDSEGALVTYRSIAGQVKYLWPISQPISDFGVQRGRLYTIRRALGWGIVGCEADVAECSQIEAPDLSLKGYSKMRVRSLLTDKTIKQKARGKEETVLTIAGRLHSRRGRLSCPPVFLGPAPSYVNVRFQGHKPAKRPRAFREGSLTSKLARVSPKGPRA
eukprot:1161596-Pelagomonas_calceolata.AAC.3